MSWLKGHQTILSLNVHPSPMTEDDRYTVYLLVCDQVTSVGPRATRAQDVAVDVSTLRTVSTPSTDALVLCQLSHPHNRWKSLSLWGLRLTYRSNIARHISKTKPAGRPVAFLNKGKVSCWAGAEQYMIFFLRLLLTPVETVRFSLPCSEEGAAAPKATKAMETAMSLVKYILRTFGKLGQGQCLECLWRRAGRSVMKV